MSVREKFVRFLKNEESILGLEFDDQMISEELISPFQIKLEKTVLDKMRSEVSATYILRAWSEKNLKSEFEAKNLPLAPNFSVCNSFDFHLDAQQNPKLIEINTNAAFLSLGTLLYKFWDCDNSTGFSIDKLVQMFVQESKLVGQSDFNLAIVDENPTQQRLFIEFLVYQQIFKIKNLNCRILDIHEIDQIKQSTLIYNRYTDFYLEEKKSEKIKKLYQDNFVSLSPSPWEYFLLADKQRLFDWQNQTDIPVPNSLLKIYDLTTSDKDFIWSERKKLFFKPKSSFGGKQVYKGASITRKTFDEVCRSGFIAQEFIAAPEVEVVMPVTGDKVKFKYDLRCFTYKDDIQLVIARLYQGQTTNLKTVGGGFAIVKFE